MRGDPSEGLRINVRANKALRTTNALERLNGEFRRRTKTQASLPGQDAVLLLLFGLLRSGQIKLRVLDGYKDMKEVKKAA
jgi:putative transposase